MKDGKENKILVTGAAGHLGRRVVELLLDSGRSGIIATTREPARLGDLAKRGVEVRKADFDQESSVLAEALAGAERMLLVSTDALDRPGHRYEQHKRAIEAAVRAGVGHVVYTSLAHAAKDSPVLIASDHVQTEAALEESGLGYTTLRNNLYADLLLMSLPAALASGRLFAAAGSGGAAYVTREDCARTAAAVLTDSFDGKRQLEVTGPETVTYADLASLAHALTGKPVEYVAVDEVALVAGMIQGGVPEPVARLMASFDIGMARGLFGPATDVVESLTGHKPQSVRAFLEANRDHLVGGAHNGNGGRS